MVAFLLRSASRQRFLLCPPLLGCEMEASPWHDGPQRIHRWGWKGKTVSVCPRRDCVFGNARGIYKRLTLTRDFSQTSGCEIHRRVLRRAEEPAGKWNVSCTMNGPPRAQAAGSRSPKLCTRCLTHLRKAGVVTGRREAGSGRGLYRRFEDSGRFTTTELRALERDLAFHVFGPPATSRSLSHRLQCGSPARPFWPFCS